MSETEVSTDGVDTNGIPSVMETSEKIYDAMRKVDLVLVKMDGVLRQLTLTSKILNIGSYDAAALVVNETSADQSILIAEVTALKELLQEAARASKRAVAQSLFQLKQEPMTALDPDYGALDLEKSSDEDDSQE